MPATKSHVQRNGLICTNPRGVARGATSLHAAVYVFPVSHLHYQDKQSFIPNLINDAAVLPRPNIDAIELLVRLHLHDAMRAWILFEAENVPVHLPPHVRIELADLPFGGRSNFNEVGQDLVPQYPHKVTERDSPLFFGFRQSCVSVFQIDSVHFLLGQTLQQTEIFHRDDGGQILPAAGDNRALLCVGRAVYDVGEFFPRFRDIQSCHISVPFVLIVPFRNSVSTTI